MVQIQILVFFYTSFFFLVFYCLSIPLYMQVTNNKPIKISVLLKLCNLQNNAICSIIFIWALCGTVTLVNGRLRPMMIVLRMKKNFLIKGDIV